MVDKTLQYDSCSVLSSLYKLYKCKIYIILKYNVKYGINVI